MPGPDGNNLCKARALPTQNGRNQDARTSESNCEGILLTDDLPRGVVLQPSNGESRAAKGFRHEDSTDIKTRCLRMATVRALRESRGHRPELCAEWLLE
jgi:hypothetical protein